MARRGPRNRPIAEETEAEENIYSREAAALPENAAVVAEPVPCTSGATEASGWPAGGRTAAVCAVNS